MAKGLVAVIDAGTTNVKAHLVDSSLVIVDRAVKPIDKTHPQPGWVEQDPAEIYYLAIEQLSKVLRAERPVALAITNQRETFVVWDSKTGLPIYPAIVWEDNRGEPLCQRLNRDETVAEKVRRTTGLPINSYFSASKLSWLLNELKPRHPERLRFGTIDSWLLYRLTGVHATDYTNAARTLLFDIHRHRWDPELLNIFAVPQGMLPQPRPSFGDFGFVKAKQLDSLPVLAMAGDQQSSLYAAGTTPGTIKVTYGTGIFPLKLLDKFELVKGLNTTLAIGSGGRPMYALEGKVANAAARVTPVLKSPPELKEVVIQLANEAQPILSKLIDEATTEIYVDGGISQNQDLLDEQAKLSGIKFIRKVDHDGTAIGVAKLVFDNLNLNNQDL